MRAPGITELNRPLYNPMPAVWR